MSRPCKLSLMRARLCSGSFFDFYSFDSVYRNLRESTLFILYVNEQDFEDFGFKMLTVGTARF